MYKYQYSLHVYGCLYIVCSTSTGSMELESFFLFPLSRSPALSFFLCMFCCTRQPLLLLLFPTTANDEIGGRGRGVERNERTNGRDINKCQHGERFKVDDGGDFQWEVLPRFRTYWLSPFLSRYPEFILAGYSLGEFVFFFDSRLFNVAK